MKMNTPNPVIRITIPSMKEATAVPISALYSFFSIAVITIN